MNEDPADCGRLDPLAAAVAGGATVRAAADAIGLSERTAYRLSGSVEFKRRVSELRTEATFAAVGILNNAASLAAETMVELLGKDHIPKDRLSAAKMIIGTLVPLAEHSELRLRLDALEQER